MKMFTLDDPIKFLLAITAYIHVTSGKGVPDKCEPITVNLCKNMPYNYTKLPNSMNHGDQKEINKIMLDYDQLLQTRCSEYLQKFLCSLFVPICTELDNFILPCKDLCFDSKKKCEKHMKGVGYSWPDILDCEKFPQKDQERYVCVPLEADNNNTVPDSTELWFAYKDVDSKEVEVDTSFKEQTILLLSTRNQISQYNVPTQDLITLYTGLDNGAVVDFHYTKQYIFWAGVGDRSIHRARLILDGLREELVFGETVQSNIESIAVDWLTDHLFWLESFPASLKVSTLNGINPTVLYDFGVKKNNNLKLPRFLAVDPLSGYLFWVEYQGDVYTPGVTIERFDLKTRAKMTIFNTSGDAVHSMGRPKGLALDLEKKRVYWTDASSESIQSIGYNGKSFKMLVTSEDFLGEPLALSKFRNNLFWSDDITNSIGTINIDNGKQPAFIETLTSSEAIDVKVFHADVQPEGKAPYEITLVVSQGNVSYGNLFLLYITITVFIMF